MPGVLDALLDARAGRPQVEPVAEAFSESKIKRRPRGAPGGGRFANKLGVVATAIPEGSGPAGAQLGRVSSKPRAPERSQVPGPLRGRTSPRTGRAYDAPKPPRPPANRRKLTEDELPKAVGRGKWSRPAKALVPKLLNGSVEDTEQGHRIRLRDGSLGPYTPERIELHTRIVRSLLQGAGSHETPRAIFMAGGPASGKSSLLKAGAVKYPPDAVDVNPDIVKTMLPEYDALVAAGDKTAAAKVHEESSHLAKLAMNIAIERGHHVVVDGTGNGGPGKFAKKIRAALDAGLDVSVHYATIDIEEAVRRAAKRGERTGRIVPAGYLRSAHRDVTERFLDEIRQLPVRIDVFETDGKKPRKVWSRTARTEGEIHDRQAWERFMAKAGRKVESS